MQSMLLHFDVLLFCQVNQIGIAQSVKSETLLEANAEHAVAFRRVIILSG